MGEIDSTNAALPDTELPVSSGAVSRERLHVGDEVGRFTLVRELGEGGMGLVYVARDPTLGRDVALKLVHPTRGSTADRARLLREAQAMARVTHANVVPVFEAGVYGDLVFVVMELVDGVPLSTWLESPRTVREVLEKFVQAGRGLAAAHEAGILHRDFKPQNVLVGRDGRARVLDFGLARAVTLEVEASPEAPGAAPLGHALAAELTAYGTMMGTPSYMSPEHFAGEAVAASDQWSFAVALYRALFGRLPFQGHDLLSLRHAVVSGAPEPPPREVDVPAEVKEVVLRALAREPSARFPSMRAMVEALEAELSIDPSNDPARSRKQRRVVAAVVLAVGVANFAVVGVRSGFRYTIDSADLFRMGVFGLVLLSSATLLFRRRVLADAHGRRVMAFMISLLVVMTAHRGIAHLGGDALAAIVRGDAFLGAGMAFAAAIAIERWMAWLIPLFGVVVVLSFVWPAAMVSALGLALLSGLVLALLFWRDDGRSSGLIRSDSRASRDATPT
ncbi:MAG: serine/threonine protein kinase [Deltaproteobacteria bacterium]|nr:serine/threonine protein kinase [Deltaproteobacteria bacterium]